MKRLFGFAVVAMALTLAVPAQLPADGVKAGTWRLTTLAPTGNVENTNWLFKIENDNGKTTATVLAASTANATLVNFNLTGDKVRFVVNAPSEQVFEGRVSADGKKIWGIFGAGQIVNAAYMATTDLAKLEAKGQKQKLEVTVDDLKAWVEVANPLAVGRGLVAVAEINTHFSAAFTFRKNAQLAVDRAVVADGTLSERSPIDLQVKVLQSLSKAYKDAGRTAEVKRVNERLETALDTQYMAQVPPFKGRPYPGRKSRSDRVVVMELFTGAQCAPCIAADVAFDVLQKTYKTSDLVLLQYHLHIPGPDPMTNADTEGRAKYYKASSTPSTFFNGGKAASGGGAMTAAEKKYQAYCKVIDPLLETATECKVTATAKLVNNKVRIQTNVTGVAKPGDDLKLRVVLVEDTIRYTGSNKLRFHHQVVRAMPGGVAGVSITNANFSASNEVDLSDLRKQLVNYLDNYALTKKAFPQAARPLDLKGLRVIAMVQDEASKEILQAVQVNVAE